MTNSYFIRLSPLATFFFGGEKNFGSDDQAPENYLVKSRFFPQQTSLLGLIRYCLLIQNKAAFDTLKMQITDPQKVEKLIGKTGFRVDPNTKFGTIKQISPVSIFQQEKQLFPLCLGAGYSLKLETNASSYINAFPSYQAGPLLMDREGHPYREKEGFHANQLVDEGAKTYCFLKEDKVRPKDQEVFVEHKQVGILKNKRSNEEDDSDAFYKLHAYRMKPGFSFGFHLRLEDGELKAGKSIVHFGGDASLFMMEIKKSSYPNPASSSPNTVGEKIILSATLITSTAFLSPLL